jgi:hypothetical protein
MTILKYVKIEKEPPRKESQTVLESGTLTKTCHSASFQAGAIAEVSFWAVVG